MLVGALETERRSEVGWRNHGFAMLLLAGGLMLFLTPAREQAARDAI